MELLMLFGTLLQAANEAGVTDRGIKLIAAGLAIGLGALGPGIGLGVGTFGAVQAISRNPDAEGSIRTAMILGLGFAEAVAIYALVVALVIVFVG